MAHTVSVAFAHRYRGQPRQLRHDKHRANTVCNCNGKPDGCPGLCKDRAMLMTKFSQLFSAAVQAIPSAQGLTVAIIGPVVPDYAAAFVAAGAQVHCVDMDGVGALPQERPSILIVDQPAKVSARRVALLVAQLRWGNPDLVVLVADGMVGVDYGFPHDLSFDPKLGPAHAEDTLSVARHLLCHSRIRAAANLPAPVVPVLRPATGERRKTLFR